MRCAPHALLQRSPATSGRVRAYRRRVRALAAVLAMLALAMTTLGAEESAAAATSAPTPSVSSSRLAEELRKVGEKQPASASTAGESAAGPSTAGTTTYVPAGAVTSSPTTTTPAATAGTAPTTVPSAPVATTPATTTPGVAPAATAAQAPAGAPKASKGDRPLSTGAIVIAALAALLVIACVGWALARRRAFEPHWLLSLRHATAEAGFRASATWSEFLDWVRLGH
ncbi:MAG TPA: hypothetical protein VH081_09170 [Solirubrobacteraceae bacterium]|nr:hypothetical protein [Solirubrobacteraceae bacterium]